MTPQKARGLYRLFTQAETIAFYAPSIRFPIYRSAHINYSSKVKQPCKHRKQGVYFLILDGAVVYVGASMKSIRSRCNFHQSNKSFDTVRFLPLSLRWESIMNYEREFITLFDPFFNDEIFDRNLSCYIPRAMIERQAGVNYDLQARVFSEYA